MIELFDRLRAYRFSVAAPWFAAAWDLNLFVARDDKVGTWGDFVIAACTDDVGHPIVLTLTATGDAWGGEWTRPTNPNGCLYTLDGHYPRALELGTHKGRPALRQVQAHRYVRWPMDAGRIPTVPELEKLVPFTGIQGTHIHNRASDKTPKVPGPDDSEGCTVLLMQHEHAALMRLVQQQKDRHGTGIVSPTYCKRTALGL